MSIDGIKSRNNKGRSLDGFSRKPVSIQKKSVSPTKKSTVKNPSKNEKIASSKKLSQSVSPKEKISEKGAAEEFLTPVESFDFDISSDEITEDELKGGKKKQKKKKKHILRRILLAILLLLIIFGVVVLIWGNDIISKITGGQSGIFDVISFVQEDYVDLKTAADGRTNVLVFGTSGYDMEGTNGDYAHDGAQLTDTIMIVSLDQKTGDVAMINLPRDLKVSNYCTGTGKINEVYWCHNLDGNDEKSGAEALMEEVGDILGIELQYYAHVNWNTLVTVVDTLGGITVTVDEDINDYLYTGIVINAGVPTLLDGEKALGLARARHGTELGDFSRGNSQQKILIALKERILEKGLSVFEAINILNSLGDNVRTNISLDEVKTGMHILETSDLANMRQIPLIDPENDIYYITTAMINEISYVVPYGGEGYYSPIRTYVEKMLSSDPIVREGSTIEILNGSDKSDVASFEKTKLENEGFVVSAIGDAPDGEYDSFAIYELSSGKSGTKARLQENYGVQTRDAESLPDGIVSDADFLIIIGDKEIAE